MILSNVEIQKAIDNGDVVIRPEPTPRRVMVDGESCPYATTAVNLRLGERLAITPKEPDPIALDLRRKGIAKTLTKLYDDCKASADGGYALDPHRFALAQTIERVELPIRPGRPTYAARVEGRSSFARCGLLIHFTIFWPPISAQARMPRT
jgi:dCTP deaminase